MQSLFSESCSGSRHEDREAKRSTPSGQAVAEAYIAVRSGAPRTVAATVGEGRGIGSRTVGIACWVCAAGP
jgi:hypothetical protein